jgi:peptide/nickel transport system substrate-binding protein
MLALYRAGRQADALNAYRDARTVLVEQIGVEPGAELRRLQEAILAQDPALDLAPPAQETRVPRPPRSRAAPVLAVAGLLLFAGVLAFGISRVIQPDSLAGIAENHVGLIDADSGRITAEYRVGNSPEAMAAGAGSVWVANRVDGTIARISDERDEMVTIDVGGEPTGLAFGAGSLWVADGQGRTVAQIDPGVNKVVQRFDVGNAAHAVAAGSDAVWVASAIDATVSKIDPKSGRISRPIGVEARPTALAAGAGAIWVVSEATARVLRLDPRTGTALDSIPVGNGPSGVAVGAGAVWVANRIDGTVYRIDPDTDRVTEAVRVGREPRAIAAGDDGVWVANAGDGTVMRIDPRDREVTDTVATDSRPAALAVVDGTVWTAALAATAAHRGGTLRVSHMKPLPSLPSLIEPAYFFMPASLAYDGLIAYRRAGGSAGGTLVADLADDVPEPSPDGRTYVFRLRRNVRFSDGAPVRPEDVRASFERLTRVPHQDFTAEVPPLRGAARCTGGPCDLSQGIDTDSAAGTVTFHLTRPDPEFMHKVQSVFIVPAGSPARDMKTTGLPGTGPYMIDRWDPRRGGLLVRNPHFDVRSPDRPDGFPDQIAFRLDPERAQISAVERGAADIALLPREIHGVARLRTRHGARLHTDPHSGTWFAFLNVHTPPFDDPRVRQALNYAVDRGRVAELFGGQETQRPTCQLLPPGLEGYTPACRFTVNPNPAGTWTGPDLERARRLIAASGTRGMTVEFWGTQPWPQIGRYFRSLLTRLGYRGELRTFDDLFLIFQTASGEPRQRPQIGLWGWESGSSFNFMNWLVSCSSPYNLARFCDPEIDALMKRAAGARGQEASELWQRVEASLADDAPNVPLVNSSDISLTAERVGNYQYHPLWGPLVDQLWVK